MRRPKSDYHDPLHQRVAKLESDVRHLGETIDSLDRFMRHNLEAVSQKLDQVSEKGRITWPLIFTAIGTVASITAIAGVMHAQSLRPLFEGIQDVERELTRHVELPGHAEARISRAALQIDVERLHNRIDTLEQSLRREMRMLNKSTQQRVDSLDRRARAGSSLRETETQTRLPTAATRPGGS